MHVIAAKAVAFKEALEPEFKAYQEQVVKNAQAMAKTIIARGYKIVSGGTQNHLMLVDMIGKDVSGKGQAEKPRARRTSPSTRTRCRTTRASPSSPAACASAPRRSPPAATRNGLRGAGRMDLRRAVIALDNPNDDNVIAGVRENVTLQCRQFPVYGG